MTRTRTRTHVTGLGFLAVSGLVGLVACVAIAIPAGAVTASGADDNDADTVVVITGDVRVTANDHVDNIVVVNGDVRLDGTVQGDVFVVNGNVVVAGRVKGDVTSLNGRVTLLADATVGGDVVSKDAPRIADGARVNGEIDRARDRFALGRLGTIGRVFLWVAASVSSFLLGAVLLLVAPRAAEAIASAGRTGVGPAIGLGVALVFGVPLLGVLLSVTLLGLPLGLALLFALALFYGVGYAAGAIFVGRLILAAPRNRWLSFLAGWGALRVVAIVPVLGALVLFAAVVMGLGAIAVAIYRSQRSGPRLSEPAPVPVA